MRLIPWILLLPVYISGQLQLPAGPLRFLALGDSYTIGQSVAVQDRWPVQLSDSLASRGYVTAELKIIATTGWRTDNLINAIRNQALDDKGYNLVSLLIGVNNQYQSRPFNQYIHEFPALVDSAIRYAGGDKSKVFIVSIPDYAYTPFGQGSSNPLEISQEIDEYNEYNRHIADSLEITYFNITPISRQGLDKPTYVAGDGLHPSGIQYMEWVKIMLSYIDQFSTSVYQQDGEGHLDARIFPNPTSDRLELFVSEAEPGEVIHLQITDLNGNVRMTRSFSETKLSFSIADLPNGLYQIFIASGKKRFSETILKLAW